MHLFMSGTGDPELRRKQLQANYEEIKEVVPAHIRAHLRHGVVAVRDGGDYGDFTVRFKQECFDRGTCPVYLKVAGRAWHAPGRYGKLIGRSPEKGESLARAIRQNSRNKDHVKVLNSGLNSLQDFGRETRPQFPPHELEEARVEVSRLGLKLMVHANGRLPVRQAVEAGCDSIEHGFFMGEENLRLMAEKGTFWVPTAITMKAYGRMLEPGSIEAEMAKKNLKHQLGQIKKARELGVKLAVGTDAGSLGVNHGQAVREEIGLFQEAGLTIEEAVKCATFNGAVLLGLEKEIGLIGPGFQASFILVQGDPSQISGSLLSPRKAFVRGRPI